MDKIERAVMDLNGEWPEHYFEMESFPDGGGKGYATGSGNLVYAGKKICTYPEFMEARKRLENKPSEWPDGANIMVYSKSQGGWMFGSFMYARVLTTAWIGHGDGKWLKGIRPGRFFGEWRQSLERRPQPDQKEGEGVKWDAGDNVRIRFIGSFIKDDYGKWGNAVIRYISEDNIVWEWTDGHGAGIECAERVGNVEIQPIQSHRDKVINAAMQVEVFMSDGVFTESPIFAYNVLAELYDDGMLKLPEDDR